MVRPANIGADALEEKGWWGAYKWLLLRRGVQLAVLTLFLSGPVLGVWIVKGNIASSMTLEMLPLSDPFVLLQAVLAGHWPLVTSWIGAGLVLGFYFLFGGRVYCAWVCPINIITDAAAWLRRKLGMPGKRNFSKQTRYGLLGVSLVLPAITGVIVWELVNPVTLFFRGMIFGLGTAVSIAVALFLFDLFVSNRGWCGRLCPMGAFYSLLAWRSPLRVRAVNRHNCNDCMDCYAVCPEPQVITPALKTRTPHQSDVIQGINCTNCGRCIDVCSKNVFRFGTRYHHSAKQPNTFKKSEARP